MTIASVAHLLDALRRHGLLEPRQLEEVVRLQAVFPDPRLLARELVKRGWLTPYQVNQLFLGRGQELLLGSYVLLDKLGEGGMGAVFKARHQKLGRTVAVKVIRREHLARDGAVRRFQREIQAAARLVHANVVHAYDAEEVGGTCLLVMEYVEGTDLGKVVKRRGPLPDQEACEYIRQAALGLQHALEKGMVHRDIKPSNLLLTAGPNPVVKVLDLGLARVAATASDETTTLTNEGAVMGTPDYIAPEQARNAHGVDIRADLYSLGCTFYYLLSGRVPFPGGTLTEKLLQHQLDEPEPLERLRPGVAPAVVAVVRRLMAKRPADRYQTPAELTAGLDAVRAGRVPVMAVPAGAGGSPAEPAPVATPFAGLEPTLEGGPGSTAEVATRRAAGRGWLLLLGTSAGGVLVLLLAVSLALLLRRGAAPTGAGDAGPVSEPRAREVPELLLAREKDPSVDREKLRQEVIEFRARHPGTEQAAGAAELLWRLPSPLDHLDADGIPAADRFDGQPKELVGLLGDHRGWDGSLVYSVAYSPDGKWIVSGGDRHVRLWNAATLRPRVEFPEATAVTVLFTPDGKNVITSDPAVRVWDVTGAVPKEVLTVKDPAGRCATCAYYAPAKLLAMTCSDLAVRLWDLSGPEPRERATLKGHTDHLNRPAFSPDGKTLATTSHDKTVRLWDLSADPPREKAVLRGHDYWVMSAAFSPDGRTLATTGVHDRTVRLWDLSADPPREKAVMGTDAAAQDLAFSPDGRTLAAMAWGGKLLLWDVTGPSPIQRAEFEEHTDIGFSLAFSPDGSSLVTGGEDGRLRLWDMTASPPKERVPPSAHPLAVNAVAFGPDDRTLLSAGADQVVRLWDLGATPPADRGAPFTGFRCAVTCLAFHPEGHLVAAGSTAGGLTLREFPGGKVVHSWDVAAQEVRQIAFSPSGKLLVSATGGNQAGIWTTETAQLWRTCGPPGKAVTAVASNPVGRTFAAGDDGGGVTLWDPVGQLAVLALPANPRPVSAVAFSPDGRRLAAAHDDGAVKIWDAVTGHARSARTEHNGTVDALAFSPDGKWLASAGHDGQLILWDGESGDRRRAWDLPGKLFGLAFASDNRHLAVGHVNGNVYVFRLPSAR
jgi:WD40 repeat protein/tRNA A-37 threonylcarbamoyl transferase component Bud32